MAIYRMSSKNGKLDELKKQLTDNQRKQSNIIEAIAECDNKDMRQNFYTKLSKLQEEQKGIEKDIILEEKAQPSYVNESHIKFFLKSLQKGDIDDINYKKILINVFVNAIISMMID
ncbi:MAG: hypothetical protein IJD58_05770 [Lachnospiraceae bacterium]|nr:hypothetical protein [Lachnospiraceae bacterium]